MRIVEKIKFSQVEGEETGPWRITDMIRAEIKVNTLSDFKLAYSLVKRIRKA